MINYSIVMRSVNANLIEINQAKSRINQAKKEGRHLSQPSSRPSSRARTTSTSASLPLHLLAALPKAAVLRLAAALRLAVTPTIPRVVAALRPKAAVLVTENNF